MVATNCNDATMPAKNPRLNVVMPADLKQKFEQLCKLENRSMSNMLVTLAQEAVDKAISEGKLEPYPESTEE